MINPVTIQGLRAITPAAVAGQLAADAFEGLPDGVGRCDLMRAVEAGGGRCGFSRTEVRRLVYLVRYTREIDWTDEDGLPMVWKGVEAMAEELGISRQQVNAVERRLAGKGAIAHKDSASRRRWGERDPVTGHVTKACGVDLRPLAGLYGEFIAAARAAADERRMKKAVRAVSSALRIEIRQLAAGLGRDPGLDWWPLKAGAGLAALIAERERLAAMRNALLAEFPGGGGGSAPEAAGGGSRDARDHSDGKAGSECGDPPPALGSDDAKGAPGPALRKPAGDLARQTPVDHRTDADRRQEDRRRPAQGKAADQKGEDALSAAGQQFPSPILLQADSRVPKGNRPARSAGGADPAGEACIGDPPDPAGDNGPGRNKIDPNVDFGVQHVDADRVAAMGSESWRREAEGEGWRGNAWACELVRPALGIRDETWQRAVQEIGIRAAVVVVAIIDGRCQDRATFVWNPSAFLMGCVKRARTGDLHLHRSIWGLERQQRWREASWRYAAAGPAVGAAR